ncbi:hypothetical protein QBC46DRAFT_326000 [Diplogelasinospora grovesii]|uniref:Uncharacterized protein n=1 Tax=Diplogelasinospora grovesii TaxID=303347 RepID=A0AAN6RYF1_9PEZI|nr:hypothetical protein QBC46DRAFT_326000 [Diplogelasinospora grovesii]
MSGSGGFYKYRCKYFYTHNCPNWVWANNAPCASCLAEGRDADDNVNDERHSCPAHAPLLAAPDEEDDGGDEGQSSHGAGRDTCCRPRVQPSPSTSIAACCYCSAGGWR